MAGFMFLSKAKMVPGRGYEASRKAAIRTAGSGGICLLMLHCNIKITLPVEQKKRKFILVPGRGREASRIAAIRTAGSGGICLLMLHLQHKDYSAGGTKETKVYFGTRERNDYPIPFKLKKCLIHSFSPQTWHVMALDQLKCDFSKTGHLWGIFHHNGE